MFLDRGVVVLTFFNITRCVSRYPGDYLSRCRILQRKCPFWHVPFAINETLNNHDIIHISRLGKSRKMCFHFFRVVQVAGWIRSSTNGRWVCSRSTCWSSICGTFRVHQKPAGTTLMESENSLIPFLGVYRHSILPLNGVTATMWCQCASSDTLHTWTSSAVHDG